MHNIFFIADLHIGHKNILRHQPERISGLGLTDQDDINGHDEYIMNMWHSMAKRGDHVYVVGDFIMKPTDEATKILHKLKSKGAKIHLIVGNHDKATKNSTNMFESVDLIKMANFSAKEFPFIEEENFRLCLCHYPMKSWSGKCRGVCQVYGHVHNNSPWMDESNDLAINVGFDTKLSDYKLISLEDLYKEYKRKLKGIPPSEYADKMTEEDPTFIR